MKQAHNEMSCSHNSIFRINLEEEDVSDESSFDSLQREFLNQTKKPKLAQSKSLKGAFKPLESLKMSEFSSTDNLSSKSPMNSGRIPELEQSEALQTARQNFNSFMPN